MRRSFESRDGWKMTFLALALLAMGACDFGGGDTAELGADGSAMTERDLDGARVAISENEGTTVVRTLNAAWDASGDGWVLAQDARLTIGEPRGEDDSEALWSVEGAVIGAGGTVFVANRGSLEVKAFSPDGRLLWITGGEGEGPGEFRGFRSLHWCSGSVIATDSNAKRITRLDAAGEVVDTRPWRQLERGTRPDVFHCDSTGTVARIAKVGAIPEPSGSFSNAAQLAVGTLSGTPTIVGPVGEFDGFRRGNTLWPPLLGNSVFAAASDQVVHVVTRDEAAISTYDLQGQLVRRAEWDHERRRATAQVLEDAEEYGARGYPEEVRHAHIEMWEDMEHLDSLPAVDGLVAATNGDLWIKQFRLEMEADSESWWIVSANGALRGVIEIPLGFELLWAGDDAVLGLTEGEDRDQYIEIRALMKETP